ncbi:Cytochrome P [Trema orientale]|uniref:Cytochrome P n=1 Tax=Trema orientale TaxID=63057 RepID=A0A2P5FLA7_TREOI|nr:Cytochrome P [Trema orientale]
MQPTINPFIHYLSDGIILDDGEKWAKRRKIINPAFHLEKLKVFCSYTNLRKRWRQFIFNHGNYIVQ